MFPFTKQHFPYIAVFIFFIVAISGFSAVKTRASLHDDTSATSQWSKAEVYVTAKATNDRITKKEPLSFALLEQPDEHTPTIILDKVKTFQTLVGIGGALTDASAETFYKLAAKQQQEILTAFFDKEQGNGFSLCRTNIHSCDFSSSSYTYAEVPGAFNRYAGLIRYFTPIAPFPIDDWDF